MENPVQPARPIAIADSGQRERFASAYTILEQAVSDRVFPGCTFGVFADREIVALDAVGRQTYANDSPLITPSTVYDLASVTKIVATTAMAMLLYERGALLLDQPLAAILPEFASAADPRRALVTLRHLLAHASGLPGYARLFETAPSAEALLRACLTMPLDRDPGTHAEYSDLGFILLGRALEGIAGEPIDFFCQREVFTPLGMDSTGFRPPAIRREAIPPTRAAIPPTEDDATFRHRIIQGEVQDENCYVLGGVSGHAGLFGNALDCLRFASAMLNGSLVRPQTLQLFAARAELPPGSSRALGWDTPSSSATAPPSSGTMFSKYSIGHLGYAGTSLWIDLEARMCIVLLTNRTWPDRRNQAIRQVRPLFHDAVRKSLHPVGNLT